jgi:photosystem II stability/assembly factor-like uncharacterized protein
VTPAPVTAGLLPVSVTFVSAGDGWVLGVIGTTRAPLQPALRCPTAACPVSLARTADGGRTWQSAPAPATVLSLQPSPHTTGVRAVRFADPLDGWVYGPGLYATHDGGASWHRVQVPGAVGDLEAAGGVAYAVINGWLYRTPVGRDAWSKVASVPRGATWPGALALMLHGKAAWLAGVFASHAAVLYATTDGVSWRVLASPCASPYAAAGLAAYDQQRITLLCQGNGAAGSVGKIWYSSDDGGRIFVRVSQWFGPGYYGPAAQPGPERVLTAVTVGAMVRSGIEASSDSGRTWQDVLSVASGFASWSDFGFTTAAQGVAVLQETALYMTYNSGTTWSQARLPAG